MNKTIFNLLAAFLWLASGIVARSDPPSLACCDIIQLTGSEVEDCTAKGQFEPVVTAPLDTANVNLQFDAALAGAQVAVQALDGGMLGTNGSATIDVNGNLPVIFQVGEQPGLYRISVVAQYGNEDLPIALVQFQVPNPEQ